MVVKAPREVVVNGLRLGSLVEIQGTRDDDVNGQRGQLVDLSGDDAFRVRLLNGYEAEFPAEHLVVPTDIRRPGQGGDERSFDLVIGPRYHGEVFAEELANCLGEKGFCVVKVCQDSLAAEATVAAMKDLGDKGELSRLASEVEEGYLGSGNIGVVSWIDPKASDSGIMDETVLDHDRFLSRLATELRPFSEAAVGRQVDQRTDGLISLTLNDTEEDEFPAPDADDEILGSYLNIYRRGLIHAVLFMGPGEARVRLDMKEELPSGVEPPELSASVAIAAEATTLLLFRPDCFEYSCRPKGEMVTLTTFLLSAAPDIQLSELPTTGEFDWLFERTGPTGPDQGESINVVNMATRLMANWDEPEFYRAGLFGGTDSRVEFPYLRGYVHNYYEPDPDQCQFWQFNVIHMSLVEGIEMFDNKYFEIANKDVWNMDPMQRHVCIVGGQLLYKMGITKKIANRTPSHGGISVGLDKDDWHQGSVEKCSWAEGGTNVQAIISNRFSFLFNMRGPNFVADTACSASLCATHMAKFMLLDRKVDKLEFHLGIGIHQCLNLAMWFGKNPMFSGCCRTFNATAAGYMRGDGCSGITLKYGHLPEERDAIWRASQCGQNGRSSTLTAPNGVAQENLIWQCYRECNVKPPESNVWCCHGTGTSLGDPIEVGAIRRVQMKENRDRSLAIITNKTSTGHLEGGAAMTTIIAATYAVKYSMINSAIHLRQLNPHLEATQFDAFINNEPNCYMYEQGNAHVSSFGFGGTNGHLILWGQSQVDTGVGADRSYQLMRKIKQLGRPQVRIMGDGPQDWESDWPEADMKPGDRYELHTGGLGIEGATLKFKKVVSDEDEEDEAAKEENDSYYITGDFNDWGEDVLEPGAVVGMRSIIIDMPKSGEILFRFLKDADEAQVLAPDSDRCNRKTARILGPEAGLKNNWLIQGKAGSSMKIDLFVFGTKRSVMWMPID